MIIKFDFHFFNFLIHFIIKHIYLTFDYNFFNFIIIILNIYFIIIITTLKFIYFILIIYLTLTISYFKIIIVIIQYFNFKSIISINLINLKISHVLNFYFINNLIYCFLIISTFLIFINHIILVFIKFHIHRFLPIFINTYFNHLFIILIMNFHYLLI